MNDQIAAYLYGHFSDEVSHETLAEMLSLASTRGRIALLGFSDYTKHVINNCGDNVVAVFDLGREFIGLNFRGHVVQPISDVGQMAGHVDSFVVCHYEHLVQYKNILDMSAAQGIAICWPENFDGNKAHKYNILEQSSLYNYRKPDSRLGEPPTMMPRETITFLVELLKASLRVSGEIAEIGVWQGGSAWNMAKMMKMIGDVRPMHLFDLFDDHVRTNPEAIMCLDEIKERFRFYPNIEFYKGMADVHMHQLSDKKFCFVHIDLGFLGDVLDFFWSRLEPGGFMLFDNYGHVGASPGLFDKYFSDRGYSVIRSPFSYQAFVAK